MLNPAIQFMTASKEEELLLIECSNKILKNIDKNLDRGKISDQQTSKYLAVRWYLNHLQAGN